VARVIRLDDDGAIAVPMADPAKVSFAWSSGRSKRAALPQAEPRGSGA
jgi:hypothetical protein